MPPRRILNDFVYKHCRFFSKNALFLARIFNSFIKVGCNEILPPITRQGSRQSWLIHRVTHFLPHWHSSHFRRRR
ncbi:hypothetical protein CUC50_01990 [Citrobacter werkmanii]|nr:hypothetical protein CUC50_01990 [Citrobacter werkmanii]